MRVETRPWQIELPSRKLEVELTTVASNYHVELNPSDVGSSDRYVVQEIIKDMARNRRVSGGRVLEGLGRVWRGLEGFWRVWGEVVGVWGERVRVKCAGSDS